MIRSAAWITAALAASAAGAGSTITIEAKGDGGFSNWFSSGWGGAETGFVQGSKAPSKMTATSSNGKSAEIGDGDGPATISFVTPNPANTFGTGTEKDPFRFNNAIIGRPKPIFNVSGKVDGFDAPPQDRLVLGDWGIVDVIGVLLDEKTLRIRAFGYARIVSDSLLKGLGEDTKWRDEKLGAVATVILTREGGFPKDGGQLEGKVREATIVIEIPNPGTLPIMALLGLAGTRRRRGRCDEHKRQ